ncbi:MAG: hypothetical protein ABDH61_01955 [Acidilobaceae archaeon]
MPLLGRRRKKRVKLKRKVIKPGRYFQCPRCSSFTLTVSFRKLSENEKIGIVTCGTCGLYCEVKVPARAERIDVFNAVSDMVYEGSLDSRCEERKVGAEDMEEYAGEEEGE